MVSEFAFNLKSRKSNNLWAFYQRFFAFEEPDRKWLHIVRAANNFGFADFLAQSKSFAVGGSKSKNNISNRLVNVLLAYEEARHFNPSVLHKLKDLGLEEYLPDSRIEYWQKTINIDQYFAQWLTLAEIYWPDRAELINLSEQDNRLEFLRYSWQSFENFNQDWHQAVKLFQKCLSLYRSKLPTDFLPRAIILVEGLTEQVLLPYLAANYGLNLTDRGVLIVPAGGAKKLAHKYNYWKERLNLSIFCLFDADAIDLANSILLNLRQSDKVYILADGEIEDLIRLEFLVDRVNEYLAEDPLFDKSKPISIDDFAASEKRTVILDKIWRKRGFSKFEKVKFAQFIANQSSKMDCKCISYGGIKMLNELTESISAINQ